MWTSQSEERGKAVVAGAGAATACASTRRRDGRAAACRLRWRALSARAGARPSAGGAAGCIAALPAAARDAAGARLARRS